MAISLPRATFSDAPQPKRRQIPLEQILAVQGNNPYAAAIDQIGPILSQALQKRADLRRQAGQIKKIEESYNLKGGELSGLPIDTAGQIGKTIYDRKNPTPKIPNFLGTSEDGKKLLFIDESGPMVMLNPIGGPLASRTRDPLADDRLALQKDRVRKDIVDRFNADPSVKKAQTAIDAANNVRALLDSKNPIAASAIPTYMARAAGEVGALSEADKAPFGGSQAILARLQAALTQKATGQLTTENAMFLKSLADVMEGSAKGNIEAIARNRSKQYSKTGAMTEQEILESLVPGINNAPVDTNLQLPTPGQKETPAQRKARLLQELQGAR